LLPVLANPRFGGGFLCPAPGARAFPFATGHPTINRMTYRTGYKLVLLTALIACGPVHAQDSDNGGGTDADAQNGESKNKDKKIYRVRDEEGNVTFTDEPPSDQASEEVELDQGNDLQMESVPETARPESDDKPEDDVGYKLQVTSPENDGVLRHPTEPVPVKYNIKPAPSANHEVQVLHNGEVLDGQALEWPIRGQHQVSVRVVDADGNVVSKSEPNTFFVHRPSKQLPYGP
jgi:hypothetical protein